MNYDNITKEDRGFLTHLSLCTGYEGIGMGLRTILPNLREVAYVEREGFCCANLENKIEKGQLGEAPIYTDVKTFPYRKFRGLVDIMSFGFPCQPFSQAGLRQATEDPRHLFPYLAEGIREMQPSIVFAENVEGILSCKTGEGEPVVQYVGRTLEEMGYRTEVGIFSASEIGAPHQRKRVFFLGISDSVRSGLCRGGSSEECRDDSNGIQSNEGERNSVRSEVEGCSVASMGDTQHDGPSTEQKLRGSSETSDNWRQKEQREASELTRTSRPIDGTSLSGCKKDGELGDTNAEGLQGFPKRQEWNSDDPWATSQWMGAFPARPNKDQYEWEQPRVLVNSTSIRQCRGSKDGSNEQSEMLGKGLEPTKNKGLSESELGGAVDGATDRVDRLRLLGNGVVFYTAAKAFAVLLNRFL